MPDTFMYARPISNMQIFAYKYATWESLTKLPDIAHMDIVIRRKKRSSRSKNAYIHTYTHTDMSHMKKCRTRMT